MILRLPIALLFLILAIASLTGDARATVRALVVGIDTYASKQQLRGSVNDATDIARVLKAENVADLTVLTENQATKNAFSAAWRDMIGRTQPGDILFMSFSGHGIRVPEKPGGLSTPDGYEKGFLLQAYDQASAPEEMLRDEDLYDLFAVAAAKGAKIVFVADACHAGAAVRSTDGRAAGSGFRFQRFQTQAAPTTPSLPEKAKSRPPIAGLTVLSATDERLAIQEVLIDGSYRGALSYAVARGLEGAASNSSGIVTAQTLRGFVSPLVRVLSGNRQIPQFTIPEPQLELIATGRQSTAELGARPRDVTLAILGHATSSLGKLDGAILTDDKSKAELIWDSDRLQLVSAGGDVIASNLGPDKLQAAIDARRLLNALGDVLAHQHGPVSLAAAAAGQALSEGAFVRRGSKLQFALDPGELRFVTIFDLNTNGTVQLVWPYTELGDQLEWTAQGPLTFMAEVAPPYGAEFIVVLTSREPLADLQLALRRIHNTIAPLELYEAFLKAYADTEMRIGIEGIYSCESLNSEGRCNSMVASSSP